MTQTKFFTRSSDNLEDYKNNFKKAISKIKIAHLFEPKVIEFLENWIDNQKSYIPREDVDNLLSNINKVYKDKEFYEYIKPILDNVENNGNILEYSFNLISEFYEQAKKYKEYKNKKFFKEKLEKEKKLDEKKQEEEIKNILDNL
jgi:hypothetical protein